MLGSLFKIYFYNAFICINDKNYSGGNANKGDFGNHGNWQRQPKEDLLCKRLVNHQVVPPHQHSAHALAHIGGNYMGHFKLTYLLPLFCFACKLRL